MGGACFPLSSRSTQTRNDGIHTWFKNFPYWYTIHRILKEILARGRGGVLGRKHCQIHRDTRVEVASNFQSVAILFLPQDLILLKSTIILPHSEYVTCTGFDWATYKDSPTSDLDAVIATGHQNACIFNLRGDKLFEVVLNVA